MQRVQPDEPFDGGAFHPGFRNGRNTGAVFVSLSGVKFTSEQSSMELPLDGLIVELGGENDQLVFFRHPSFPEWAIYANDHRVLAHPSIANARDLQSQLAKIKGTKRHAWVVIAIVAAIPILLIGLLVAGKGRMIESIADKVPASWEQEMGNTVYTQLAANKHVIDDPKLNEQLEAITGPLLKAVNSQRCQFKFHIIEDSEVNAFALPGGNVVVYTGLLLEAENPEEIAGVLAHEIAHVTRQHGIRKMIESVGLFAIMQALVGDASGLLSIIAHNAPFLLQQKFSRDFEREADNQGWDYLVAANINPNGEISFFKKIKADQEKKDPNGVADTLSFLNSHPATDERIQALEEKQKTLSKSKGFREFDLNFEEFQNNVRSHLTRKTSTDKKAKGNSRNN